MRALIVKDDGDLRRIDRAIAELERQPPAEQLRKHLLLAALRQERMVVQRCTSYRHGDPSPFHP
jgi:hypothetical protein